MNYKVLMRDAHIQSVFASARYTDVECVTHFHSNMEIVLVAEGILNMKIGKSDYTIPEGFGVFIYPFESHNFSSVQHNKCHVLMFTKESAPQLYDFSETHSTHNKMFPVYDECKLMVDSFLPLDTNHADLFKAQAILSPLFYNIHNTCEFNHHKSVHDDVFIRALEYMSEHFREDISLKSVAEHIGIHYVTLSKMFSQKTNTHFNEYLNYLRCSHAAYLLQNHNLSCTDAAFESGFTSLRTFNRAFTSIYKTTPKSFKLQ